MVKVTMAIAAYVFVMGQCKTWTLDSGPPVHQNFW